MTQSRGLKSFLDIVRSLLGYRVAGPVDYLALYPGRVVAQSADKTRVDVQLDITAIPSPSNIPLRLGIPGTKVDLNLSQTARVLVGWEGGDPRYPYASTWEAGASVTEIVIGSSVVHLAGESGSDAVVTQKDLGFLFAAITNAACVANDGGLAFKTALLANLTGGGWSSIVSDGHWGSSKAKAQR